MGDGPARSREDDRGVGDLWSPATAGADPAYIDVDQLGMCFPPLGDDPERHMLKARNVAALRANFAAAGARILVVSGVVDVQHGEDIDELGGPQATYFPVDMMWYEPRLVRFLNRMSLFARHIWFDPRGMGSSDRIHHEEGRLLESVVDDMVAVLDAIDCARAAVLGLGVPISLLFAATHPHRTAALVLADSTARVRYWTTIRSDSPTNSSINTSTTRSLAA